MTDIVWIGWLVWLLLLVTFGPSQKGIFWGGQTLPYDSTPFLWTQWRWPRRLVLPTFILLIDYLFIVLLTYLTPIIQWAYCTDYLGLPHWCVRVIVGIPIRCLTLTRPTGLELFGIDDGGNDQPKWWVNSGEDYVFLLLVNVMTFLLWNTLSIIEQYEYVSVYYWWTRAVGTLPDPVTTVAYLTHYSMRGQYTRRDLLEVIPEAVVIQLFPLDCVTPLTAIEDDWYLLLLRCFACVWPAWLLWHIEDPTTILTPRRKGGRRATTWYCYNLFQWTNYSPADVNLDDSRTGGIYLLIFNYWYCCVLRRYLMVYYWPDGTLLVNLAILPLFSTQWLILMTFHGGKLNRREYSDDLYARGPDDWPCGWTLLLYSDIETPLLCWYSVQWWYSHYHYCYSEWLFSVVNFHRIWFRLLPPHWWHWHSRPFIYSLAATSNCDGLIYSHYLLTLFIDLLLFHSVIAAAARLLAPASRASTFRPDSDYCYCLGWQFFGIVARAFSWHASSDVLMDIRSAVVY